MSYLAQGLNSGFQAGYGQMSQKIRDKKQQEYEVERDATRHKAHMELLKEKDVLDAAKTFQNNSFNASENQKARDFHSQQSNNQNAMKASLYFDEQSRRDEATTEARARADAPKPAPVPTARVRRNLGADAKGGFAEYEIPITDLEKTISGANAAAYKSPYADQIADLSGRISKQQSEIEGGDERTGFLGMGTSRKGIVETNSKQLMRLQVLELQDQLRAGVIDQAEADRRADALSGVK